MGSLGLSLGDFEALTPEEFGAVAAAGRRGGQEDWERARALACWVLQPYGAKGRPIKPADLCRFPWEERREGGEGEEREERVVESREELMARFERVKRERGLR